MCVPRLEDKGIEVRFFVRGFWAPGDGCQAEKT